MAELQIYPEFIRGLTYTVTKTPLMGTKVSTAGTKFEYRIGERQNPLWKWTLIYDYLKDVSAQPGRVNNYDIQAGQTWSDLKSLEGFFNAMQGQDVAFRFLDPDDNTVGPALIGGVPNAPAAQLLLYRNLDGTYYSPIQRNMGGFWEDIWHIAPSDSTPTLAVYSNGTLMHLDPGDGSGDYVLFGPGFAGDGWSCAGMCLKWLTTPVEPITASFQFYFHARFASDEQDFEKFMDQLWTMGEKGSQGKGYLEIQSTRWKVPSYTVFPPPPPAIGKIVLQGAWRINSRVGPYYNPAPADTLYMVMADARDGDGNEKHMVAIKSTDHGASWAIVDDGVFPALTNQIDSFDCHRVPGQSVVYVATMERSTGRVAYHTFDMSSDTWTLTNEQVKASNLFAYPNTPGVGGFSVSITVRSQSGNPCVSYTGDTALVPGVPSTFPLNPNPAYYSRVKFSVRTAPATWSSELDLGAPSSAVNVESFFMYPSGQSYQSQVDINNGRLVASPLSDNVYFFHSRTEPADGASTPDLEVQTISPSNSLGTVYEYWTTSAASYQAACPVGGYDIFTDGGDTWIAIAQPGPGGFLQPAIFMFKDSVGGIPQVTGPLSTGSADEAGMFTQYTTFADSYCTLNPSEAPKFLNGTLYVVSIMNNESRTSWKYYKTIDVGTFNVHPDVTSTNFQVGPTFGVYQTIQRLGIEMAMIGVGLAAKAWLFVASAGFAPVQNTGFMFEAYEIARDLPTPNSYTIAQWLIDHP